MATKKRLDELLVERGLAPAKLKAQALIMLGQVQVNEKTTTKAGEKVAPDVGIKILAPHVTKYVSRGGLKLEEALRHFKVNPKDKICLDVGASTGGFTDCLLQHGARLVHAVDVGIGQLDSKLRENPQVKFLPHTNARHIEPQMFDPKPNLAAIDVSFISLEKVLPSIVAALQKPFEILALVKPQFEAPKGSTKKGVVKTESVRLEAVKKIARFASEKLNLSASEPLQGSYPGPKGNIEYFLYLR